MGTAVIDWLRRANETPAIEVAGRDLPIAIRRHPRATRLTMRLAPDGSELRVTMPQWCRTADALVFARRRLDWIASQLAAIPPAVAVRAGSSIAFRGNTLLIEWHAARARRPVLAGETLQLGGPEETVARRVQCWLEGQAMPLLADDLGFYCGRAGLPMPDLRLSRATRRWGSCSGKGCVRINWRLVQAPDAVRRSVVAHEVAHLTHFDHSPAFHAHLAQLFEGDIAQADAWLRREGRTLYAAFG